MTYFAAVLEQILVRILSVDAGA